MGIEDRDYYREDAKRRDKLPHVTSRKTPVRISPTPNKPREWHAWITLALMLAVLALTALGWRLLR